MDANALGPAEWMVGVKWTRTVDPSQAFRFVRPSGGGSKDTEPR